MSRPLHNIVGIPAGMTIGDLLPVFSEVKHEVLIGRPNRECASCGKPFNDLRKRRAIIRLYPADTLVPVVCQFHLCGRCSHLYRSGGVTKEGALAAVEAYFKGDATHGH